MAKLTLFSCYNYLQSHGIDMFESMRMIPNIDADNLIFEILERGGEFGVVYANPEFVKEVTDNWVKKWLPTINRWYLAETTEYNPLHNYDRHEEYTDITGETVTGHSSASGTDGSTLTDSKSAYDSSTMQPTEQSTSSASSSSNGSSDSTTDRTLTHDAHLFGNIGVTTSATMLSEERSVRRWSLIENIACLYIGEVTIPVYM